MNTALVIAVIVDSAVTLFVGLKLKGWAARSIDTAADAMQHEIADQISQVSNRIVGEFIVKMGGTLKDTVAPVLAQLITSRLEMSASGRVDVRQPDDEEQPTAEPLRVVTEQ